MADPTAIRVPVELELDADLAAQIPAGQLSETVNRVLRAALTPARPDQSAAELAELAKERAEAAAEEAAETVKWESYLAKDADRGSA